MTDPTSYDLAYPDGAHNAETLMSDPVTGRLYIATKGVFGGTLYAVPRQPLARPAPTGCGRWATCCPIATDGAFFPDGRHLVIRDYAGGRVYAWPSLQPVADLPAARPAAGRGDRGGADGTLC